MVYIIMSIFGRLGNVFNERNRLKRDLRSGGASQRTSKRASTFFSKHPKTKKGAWYSAGYAKTHR